MRRQRCPGITPRRLALLFASCAAVALSACDADTAPSAFFPDSAPAVAKDASIDGATSDAGVVEPDAAEADAEEVDAEEVDAAEVDAAEVDAAEVDAAAIDAGIDMAEVDVAVTVDMAADRGPADTATAPILHRLLMVDNGGNKLILLDQKNPAKGWSITIPAGSRDLQLVAGGSKVLVSHGTGAAEYALSDGTKGWTVAAYTGVSTAQRLPNGNTMIGSSSTMPSVMVFHEVDPAGVEVAKVTVTGLDSLRLARRLDNGNTLFTGEFPAMVYNVYEAKPDGSILWSKPLPGKGYVAQRLPNGNTLATTGSTVTLVELDPSGAIVKTLGGLAAHPNDHLIWFSGFQVLANGNTVIANWLGDMKNGMGPHAVELDPSNKLVWSWQDFTAAMTVTNLLVLE
jgi:hypothetical protein